MHPHDHRFFTTVDGDGDVYFRVRKVGNDGRASKNICSKVPSHLVANKSFLSRGNRTEPMLDRMILRHALKKDRVQTSPGYYL